MSIGSFLTGGLVGALVTYWGSERVHNNITDSLEKTERLLRNEQEINNRCYQQIQQWYHEGSLGAVINIMQQQAEARNANLNIQATANNQGIPAFSPSR